MEKASLFQLVNVFDLVGFITVDPKKGSPMCSEKNQLPYQRSKSSSPPPLPPLYAGFAGPRVTLLPIVDPPEPHNELVAFSFSKSWIVLLAGRPPVVPEAPVPLALVPAPSEVRDVAQRSSKVDALAALGDVMAGVDVAEL